MEAFSVIADRSFVGASRPLIGLDWLGGHVVVIHEGCQLFGHTGLIAIQDFDFL